MISNSTTFYIKILREGVFCEEKVFLLRYPWKDKPYPLLAEINASKCFCRWIGSCSSNCYWFKLLALGQLNSKTCISRTHAPTHKTTKDCALSFYFFMVDKRPFTPNFFSFVNDMSSNLTNDALFIFHLFQSLKVA